MLTLADATRLFDARRAAWLREDVDGYLGLWADDMTFAAPSHPEPLRGREAFGDLVRRSNALTRPVRFNVLHLAIAGENVVLAEWVITVEHRATGRQITWRGMSRCTLRDGLIVEWREYWNPADVAAASALAVQR
jgi:ketosteroid isomerase-like protein